MGEVLTVYAVRNASGEWMRSTGYGGRGKHWVEAIADAKLYTKIGQARARVTFWANHGGKPPVIVAFSMQFSDAEVLEEVDRVAAAKLKKATAMAEQEKREATRRLRAAEETIRRANAEIQAIRSGQHKSEARDE